MKTQDFLAELQANVVSPPFVVSVGTVNPGDSRLTPPSLDQAVGDSVDLKSFSGDALARIAPWPLIVPGQRVWLSAHGRALDGSDLDEVVFDGDVVTANMISEGPFRPLSRSYLEGIANGSELRLEGKLAFKGEAEAGAIRLPSRRYTIEGSRSFHLETFEECALGFHGRLQSDYFRTLHGTTVLQGKPGSGFEGKYVEGNTTTRSNYFYADLINAAGQRFPSRKIRFACLPVIMDFVEVYDIAEERISDAVVTMEPGRYTVASTTPICRILIRAPADNKPMFVDSFELYPDG